MARVHSDPGSLTGCLPVSPGRCHLSDLALEPSVLHDLLHRDHGKSPATLSALQHSEYPGAPAWWAAAPGGEAGMGGQHLTGSAACAAAHAPALPLCARPGGDDHHCRLHPRGLCLPHELQPQEPGLGRSVQAAVAGAVPRLVWLAAQLSAVWLSSPAVWLSRLLAVQRICLVYLLHLSVH